MKNRILRAFVFLYLFSVTCQAAPLSVPVATDGQYAEGWGNGTAGYRADSNGDVHLYLGNTRPWGEAITDPTAIRGNAVRRLSVSDYAVSVHAPAVASGSDISLTWAGAAETNAYIDIKVADGSTIRGVSVGASYSQADPVVPMTHYVAWFKSENEPSAGRICIHAGKGSGSVTTITNIEVYVRSPYGVGVTNDLTELEIMMRDGLGSFALSSLRPWAAHLYDGNRGTNWSAYAAYKPVNLAGQTLAYDAARLIRSETASYNGTNAVTTFGGGQRLCSVILGTETSADADVTLSIESVEAETNGLSIALYCSVGFASADMAVQYSDDMAEWRTLPVGTYSIVGEQTVGGRLCTVFLVPYVDGLDHASFRFVYLGATSNVAQIRFHVPPVFERGLYLGNYLLGASAPVQTLYQRVQSGLSLADGVSIYKPSQTNITIDVSALTIPKDAVITFEVYAPSNTYVWPSNVAWLNDSAITSTNALFALRSFNAGTNWIANKEAEW